ncbi:MAG: sulfite exporter TauE/SafE family protein [Bryobacteraceae bacterium]
MPLIFFQSHPSISILVSRYGALMAVAFAAGALNAVAGGGSFFSFPTLIGVGLPPVNANATNTVALWPGQLTSMVALRREVHAIRRMLPSAIACAAVGGFAGARTLLFTKQATFLRLVPWLLLFATVLFALSGPARKWLERRRPSTLPGTAPGHPASSPALLFWMTVVCFYIGYFGAGAGILLFALFSVFGFTDFHESNALKILCNAVANGVAVVTFILAHAVYWKECLVMLFLAAAGGYFGAAYSRKLNPKLLRSVVIVTGLTVSAYFFWKTL